MTADIEVRGAGIEIRLYGADPDRIEASEGHGNVVLAGSMDNRTGCENAMLSDRTVTSSCRARRLKDFRVETVF